MAKDKKKENPVPEDEQDKSGDTPGQTAPEPAECSAAQEPQDSQAQLLAEAADKYLRLAAEYDNYRKRTAKEKESAWSEAKAQTVAAFLPVYDNLERAMKQETADEAYKKGVELTMKGFQDALASLGVEVTMRRFLGAVHGFIPHFMDHWQEGAELIARSIRTAGL